MTIERADFDDLVTLVSQAPPWEKDRAAGIRILLRAIGEGKANAPDQILQRWTWKLAKATRKIQDRRASAEFPEAKRLLGAVANSRGHRHEENVNKLVQVAKALPLDVGAALLASSEGYTPRANNALDRAREELGETMAIANALADNLPAPKAPSRKSRRRKRKKKPGEGQAQAPAAAQTRRGRERRPAPAEGGETKPKRAAPPPQAGRGRRRRRARRARGRTDALRVAKVLRVLILIAIGFVAGIVTALSPCVLPVLPIVLAGGATGRRPLAIVAGIVVSFTVFTLFAAWLLDLLGLPQDVLRNLAIGLLLLVALTLLVPKVGELLARPLQRLTRRGSGDHGGGFLLGASLGLVFVPCAGPVLAAVTVLAAQREFGIRTIALTLAYALGAALPMLAIALAGQRGARRLRANAETVRRVSGVLVGAAALAIALGADRELQTWLPGYTETLQDRFERSEAAQRELRELTGSKAPEAQAGGGGERPDRLRGGARVPGTRRLDQLQAADPRRAAGPRRPDRLLDVLVHQLPADAPLHPRVGRALPRRPG